MGWLEQSYFGNSVRLWLVAVGVVLFTAVGLRFLQGMLTRRLSGLADRTATEIDDLLVDLLRKTKPLALLAVAVYVGSLSVVLPQQVATLVRILLTVALALQAAVWGNLLISTWLAKQFPTGPAAVSATGTGYGALGFIARVLLWSVILLMALDNLGVNVTTLLAGLGVGGIAVALAVQNILGDVFCSLSIILDKPFEIGDFIIVGDLLGTVEHIGIKTTRVLSLRGEQIVFSNSDLVGSRIQNFKRMQERRILFTFGVTYQTPADQVEQIPRIVHEIIDSVDGTRVDRVHFQSYGDSALIFEIVYYVSSPDYNVYMDVQQAVNLALLRRFEKEGIEFAYPTQTLYVHREG